MTKCLRVSLVFCCAALCAAESSEPCDGKVCDGEDNYAAAMLDHMKVDELAVHLLQRKASDQMTAKMHVATTDITGVAQQTEDDEDDEDTDAENMAGVDEKSNEFEDDEDEDLEETEMEEHSVESLEGKCSARCQPMLDKFVKQRKEWKGINKVCQRNNCAGCDFCKRQCQWTCWKGYKKLKLANSWTSGYNQVCSQNKCVGCTFCAGLEPSTSDPTPDQSDPTPTPTRNPTPTPTPNPTPTPTPNPTPNPKPLPKPIITKRQDKTYWNCQRKGVGNEHGYDHSLESCAAGALEDPACKQGKFDYNQEFRQCKCVIQERCSGVQSDAGWVTYVVTPPPTPNPTPLPKPIITKRQDKTYWNCQRKGVGNEHGFDHSVESCAAGALEDPACKQGKFDYNQNARQCKCVTQESCNAVQSLAGWATYVVV